MWGGCSILFHAYTDMQQRRRARATAVWLSAVAGRAVHVTRTPTLIAVVFALWGGEGVLSR